MLTVNEVIRLKELKITLRSDYDKAKRYFNKDKWKLYEGLIQQLYEIDIQIQDGTGYLKRGK